MPTLDWFDDFLRRSRKALLLVSHDREFLDRQISRVLSFEPEGLRAYPGNYEDYLGQRADEEEQLAARAERQEKRRAQTLAFIDRFRAKASKARQAQSRLKQLEKEEIVQVRETRASVRFRFPDAPRSGREVARLERVCKSFGGRAVYRNLSGQILRGVHVVGGDQARLKVIQNPGVDLAAGHEFGEIGGEPGRTLVQLGAQALEKPADLGGIGFVHGFCKGVSVERKTSAGGRGPQTDRGLLNDLASILRRSVARQ